MVFLKINKDTPYSWWIIHYNDFKEARMNIPYFAQNKTKKQKNISTIMIQSCLFCNLCIF